MNAPESESGIESFIERDMDAMRYVGSVYHPSVSINNRTFRGEYDDPNELFKAICSSIMDKPDVC